MRILLRNFNDKINSKTGAMLPPGQRRGTPDWAKFDDILLPILDSLGDVTIQPEHPIQPDHRGGFHHSIYCHRTRREKPQGSLFYMQMHLRWLFTLDTHGWGADHSDNGNKQEIDHINQEEATQWVRNLADDLLASQDSKCPQSQGPVQSPQTQFILVPIQIPRDYTIRYHSPITVRYFMDSLENWANESQNHIAFKLHPYNHADQDLVNMVNEASRNNYVHKAEGNIHELIKRSKGLFVINSGTGFEGLIHGKPVATFGNCDYNKVTFNADIRRVCEARNHIFGYTEEKRELAYKYIYWYITQHAYDVRDPNTPKRLKEYICSILSQ